MIRLVPEPLPPSIRLDAGHGEGPADRSHAGTDGVAPSIGNNAEVAPYSGHMLEIVARSGTVGAVGRDRRTRRTCQTTPCSRSFRATVSTRSVAVAPNGSNAPDHRTPTTVGSDRESRFSQHRGLRFDAADPPSEHAEAVHHSRVGIGPDHGVGEGLHGAVPFAARDDRRDVFEVDLVHDSVSRRHDSKLLEGGPCPAQENVPLGVAFVLVVEIHQEGPGLP